MSPTVSSLLSTDDGSLRVTRMLFIAFHGQEGPKSSQPAVPALLVPHRLAVPAVIASHRGLDQAAALGIPAGDQRQQAMAGMRSKIAGGRRRGGQMMPLTRDR